MEKKIICCICGERILGKGHCAEPVHNGICCDKCRKEVVVPRIKELLTEFFR